MFFQHASERDFVETVEQITGRKVRAFASGVDTRQDVSSEVFYFEPVEAAEERHVKARGSRCPDVWGEGGAMNMLSACVQGKRGPGHGLP
jgi:hypothetical protein